MKIKGIQKLTLLDFPGRTGCTLFTGGCNFRCPFCHNASIVLPAEMQDDIGVDDVMAFLESRRGLLDGVCISGGEPLLQNGLEDFIKALRKMDYLIKLDSNGYETEKLQKLVTDGLIDFVAMDIKNSRGKYAATAGVKELDISRIEESIKFLMKSSVEHEFRTTVVSEFHTSQDFDEIGKLMSQLAPQYVDEQRYFLQDFVDSGDLIGSQLHGCDKNTLENMLNMLKKYVPLAKIRGNE